MEKGTKWRGREKVLQASEARDLYVYREDRSMEKFIDEKRSLTLAEPKKDWLPLISKESITQYKQELVPIEVQEEKSEALSMSHQNDTNDIIQLEPM